jgi:S1-C subfamily serine protease
VRGRSIWPRVVVWSLSVALGLGLCAGSSTAQINVAMIEQGIARTVMLGLLRRDEKGSYREFSSCSGSFVTPKGLILTASHCVRANEDDEKRGIKKGQLYNPEGWSTVYINVPNQVKPVLFLMAKFVADEIGLDVALVRAVDLIGSGGRQALPPDFNVPYVPIGDSDTVRIGEPVVLMGYPSVGGDTITVTRGYVTGFTVDSQGRKFEMKTDLGAPGFSGGPVINERSEQVAVHQSSQVEPDRAARSGRATLSRRLPAEWAQYLKDGTSTAQPVSPAGAASVILQGRVVDGATGAGVPGASVWVLAPGSSLEDPTSKQVVANAVTDGNGVFQAKPPVLRGSSYPVIVSATGYGRVAGYIEILARGPQTAPGSSEVAIVGTITLQRQ